MAKPQSEAGGAHYHLVEHPTATWASFVAAVREHATRTAAERADRARERHDDAHYREEQH